MRKVSIVFTTLLLMSLVAVPFALAQTPAVVNSQHAIRLNADTGASQGTNADLNGDGVVDQDDLNMLLAVWGPCDLGPSSSCKGDLNGDDIVNGADLGILLAAWDDAKPFDSNAVTSTPNTVSGTSATASGASVRASITPNDVASKVGVTPDVVSRDFRDIRPNDDTTQPNFPTKVVSGLLITEDRDLANFYIGEERTVSVANSALANEAVFYRGRIKFESGDSYLIADGSGTGSGTTNSYGLIPIEEGSVVGDTPTAKMIIDFDDNTGQFSGIGEGIVEFKIVELSRDTFRPETTTVVTDRAIDREAALPSGEAAEAPVTNDQSERRSFWNRWFASNQDSNEVVSRPATTVGNTANEESVSFFDRLRRLFGGN